MAKKKTDEGLPYFKFSISKWSTGNIQQCSLSAQGLFINLCVLYWGQRGDMYLSKMKKRFQRKLKHFDELISEDVIKLIGDKIEITFLDEQLKELGFVSEQNRENAFKRWNQNKPDAVALIPDSDGNADAMPKEEKRREEKREEENKGDAQISGNGFEYQFKEKIVPREAHDLIDAICDYFEVRKIVTSKIYNSIDDFVTTISHRNELKLAEISLQKYMSYKALSQETKHNVLSWIGTKESHYNDGQWTIIDWESKLKNYEQAKGTTRTTSAQVGGTTYSGL